MAVKAKQKAQAPLARLRTAVSDHTAFLIATSRARSWGWKIIRSVFILGFCFTILYPVILTIFRSFLPFEDAYDNSIFLIPKRFTLENYMAVIPVIDYWNTLKNTLLLSLVVTLLQTASCVLVGYGFARYDFKFKKLMFLLVIFTIVVPPQLLTLPQYLNFKDFNFLGLFNLLGLDSINLLDSFWPYFLMSAFCMGIRNGLYIFIFRQFFKGMPVETEEAAYVDGAGNFRVFAQVMLPNAVNSIVTVMLFSFVWQYNDTTYASSFLPNLKVLSLSYNVLENSKSVLQNNGYTDLFNPQFVSLLRSAAMMLILLPLLLIYLIAQKFFVQSVERSGLVG